MAPPLPETSFAYQAQAEDGRPISGTINAVNGAEATRQLQAMRLRVMQIEPDRSGRKPKPLRGDDFLAFNQQLAQLSAAGLPLEHGLRLIAQDMRSGRLAATVRAIADDLERGKPLREAFEQHRGRFPALYGKLVEAGVRTSNLPGMLLNLGQHLELVQRLRATLWRAVAYPLMVLVGVVSVMVFISLYVLPQFEVIFRDFKVELPTVTKILLSTGKVMPYIGAGLGALLLMMMLLWRVLRARGLDQQVMEQCFLPLPLVGAVVKRNLAARWCDALRLGALAGLDLPAATELAGEAVGSPKAKRDSETLVQTMRQGRRFDKEPDLCVLPPSVPAAVQFAADHNDLASALTSLAQMYQQQAELKMGLIQTVITPLLILGAGGIVGFIIMALFAPMIAIVRAVSGPMR